MDAESVQNTLEMVCLSVSEIVMLGLWRSSSGPTASEPQQGRKGPSLGPGRSKQGAGRWVPGTKIAVPACCSWNLLRFQNA